MKKLSGIYLLFFYNVRMTQIESPYPYLVRKICAICEKLSAQNCGIQPRYKKLRFFRQLLYNKKQIITDEN